MCHGPVTGPVAGDGSRGIDGPAPCELDVWPGETAKAHVWCRHHGREAFERVDSEARWWDARFLGQG